MNKAFPKITLKTLPQATAQQVADQIVRHLLTQKAQAMDDDGCCVYRSDAGLTCAAGCLIDRSEYMGGFEGEGWKGLVRRGAVPSTHADLIRDFQSAHDGYELEQGSSSWTHDEWPEMLAAVCHAHGLEFNPPQEAPSCAARC